MQYFHIYSLSYLHAFYTHNYKQFKVLTIYSVFTNRKLLSVKQKYKSFIVKILSLYIMQKKIKGKKTEKRYRERLFSLSLFSYTVFKENLNDFFLNAQKRI